MHPVKYIVLYILCCSFFKGADAQNKNKVPAAVNTLFDDLPIDDPAKNSVLRPGEDSVEKIRKNIFVTGVTSTSHCFLGEPILLTYTLYSALQSTSTVDKAPSFAGFSVNTMTAGNEQVKHKKQNGKNYRVFIVQQLQLVPLQEGALTIEPISIYNEVSYNNDETPSHYGGGIHGTPILISVDPLPVAGRPADFSGATGNFTLQVVADTIMAAGENNTLHITVGGTGNFTAVSMPEIIWPAGCEHFSANSHLQVQANSFPPSGKKLFDIPFVPAKQGSLVLPALRLSFFDTQKKMYRFVYSKPVTVHVGPAVHTPAPVASPLPVKKQLLFYLLLLITILVVAWVAIIAFWKKRRVVHSMEEVAPAPATTVAVVQEGIDIEEELKTVREFDNTNGYITAFKKLLTACLLRYMVNVSGTEEALLQQLQISDAGLAAAAGRLYAQCNNLLYAPGNIDAAVRAEMEEELIAISKKMDQVFM
jgi:hypothetical protein